MFKLVAVGGHLRGKEIPLKEGENTIGKGSDCDHVLNFEGISKKHVRIYINNSNAFLEDLKSSNGTIVNGQLTSKKTITNGDKIVLPGIIFQLVEVIERKVIIKKVIASNDEQDNEGTDGVKVAPVPGDLGGKVIHFFRYKFLLPVYKTNEEYEWSVMIGIFLAVFIAINIAITIVPILADHKSILFDEVSRRAAHYAEEIGRINAAALEQKDLDRVDTNFLNSEQGVESYELFDSDGRIVRPITRINEYTNDPFSLRARDWAKSSGQQGMLTLREQLSEGVIGIAKRIKAYNPRIGQEELVGIISIKFAPESWIDAAASNGVAYLRALLISAFVGVILFGSIYFLTIAPIQELYHQIEDGLRGRPIEIKSSKLFSQLNPLRETIKTLLQKLAEYESNGSEGGVVEEDNPAPYLSQMAEILVGIPGPAMTLSADMLVHKINLEAEDLIGIRETSSSGSHILDVAKEKGFASAITEICDESANDEGKSKKGNYEIGGKENDIYATGFIGKDGFAKGFLVTFVKSS